MEAGHEEDSPYHGEVDHISSQNEESEEGKIPGHKVQVAAPFCGDRNHNLVQVGAYPWEEDSLFGSHVRSLHDHEDSNHEEQQEEGGRSSHPFQSEAVVVVDVGISRDRGAPCNQQGDNLAGLRWHAVVEGSRFRWHRCRTPEASRHMFRQTLWLAPHLRVVGSLRSSASTLDLWGHLQVPVKKHVKSDKNKTHLIIYCMLKYMHSSAVQQQLTKKP